MFKTELFYQMFFLLCYFSECHNHPSNSSRQLTLTLFSPSHPVQNQLILYFFFLSLTSFLYLPTSLYFHCYYLKSSLIIFHLDSGDIYSLASLPSVSHFSNLFFTLLVPIVYKVMIPQYGRKPLHDQTPATFLFSFNPYFTRPNGFHLL